MRSRKKALKAVKRRESAGGIRAKRSSRKRSRKQSRKQSRKRSGKKSTRGSKKRSRKRSGSRKKLQEYHHTFRDFFHSIPLAAPAPIVLNNRHCGPSPAYVPGAYSKQELVKLAVANGYSSESASRASTDQLCHLLNQPNTRFDADITKKVCGPSPTIQFPNVYSKDELVRMAVAKGYSAHEASRSSVHELCGLLGLAGKSIRQEMIPGAARRCAPKELGGYSREEMVRMAVQSGFKKSVASRATNEELCEFLNLPSEATQSVPRTTAVSIRPEDLVNPEVKSQVDNLIDDPAACGLYGDMGAEYCNSIKLRKDGSRVCQFDANTNKCIVKAAVQSIEPSLQPVSQTAKIQSEMKLEELIDRATIKFDGYLFDLLQQRHPEWRTNTNLLQDAANSIRTQNIETFNKQFIEYAKEIVRRINDLHLANEGEAISQLTMMDQLYANIQLLDVWVQDFATKCVDEYEIRIKVDSESGEKKATSTPVSPSDVASSLAAESAKKEEEIKAATEIKEQLEQTEANELVTKELLAKQQEKIDQLSEEKRRIDEQIRTIEDYYAKVLGQRIVIDRSTLSKDPKIKLKVTVYNKDETEYLNYFRNKARLQSAEAEGKQLQLERNAKAGLRKKYESQPGYQTAQGDKSAQDDKYAEIVKDLTNVDMKIAENEKLRMSIQKELAEGLQRLKGHPTLDPKGGFAGMFGSQARGTAAKGKVEMYNNLDELYDKTQKTKSESASGSSASDARLASRIKRRSGGRRYVF